MKQPLKNSSKELNISSAPSASFGLRRPKVVITCGVAAAKNSAMLVVASIDNALAVILIISLIL